MLCSCISGGGERNTWRDEREEKVAAHADNLKQTEVPTLLSDFSQKKAWRKPGQGVLKINSDGALFAHSGDGGWSYVIRDNDGRVWKAGGGNEGFLQSAFQAELLGCWEGLKNGGSVGHFACDN